MLSTLNVQQIVLYRAPCFATKTGTFTPLFISFSFSWVWFDLHLRRVGVELTLRDFSPTTYYMCQLRPHTSHTLIGQIK